MNLEPILFIVAIVAVFYLLLIRPQQKRRKQQQQMQESIRPGTEIVTTAGMYAKVVAVDADDALLLEVAPGVTCRYMKQAVMRVTSAVEPSADRTVADNAITADESSSDTSEESTTSEEPTTTEQSGSAEETKKTETDYRGPFS